MRVYKNKAKWPAEKKYTFLFKKRRIRALIRLQKDFVMKRFKISLLASFCLLCLTACNQPTPKMATNTQTPIPATAKAPDTQAMPKQSTVVENDNSGYYVQNRVLASGSAVSGAILGS